jgi:hypothetical protein
MKKACIYNKTGLDGKMSAAIVKHWFNQQEVPNKKGEPINTLDFIGYHYGDEIPDLAEYDEVIMVGVSFPAKEMINLYETKNIIYIDHHMSAINDIKMVSRNGNVPHKGLRDTNYAACELTWFFFFPEPDGADYHAAHLKTNLKKGEHIPLSKNKIPEIVRLLGMYESGRYKGTNEEQKALSFQYGARTFMSNYEDCYDFTFGNRVLSNNEPNDYMIHFHGKTIYKYLCTEAKQKS